MNIAERIKEAVARLFERLAVFGIGQDDIQIEAQAVSQMPVLTPTLLHVRHVHSQGEMSYYVGGHSFYVVVRRGGMMQTDCLEQSVRGYVAPPVLDDPALLDDLLLTAVAPLLRRRGFFPLHAFAAARRGQGVLLVGKSGSGKTTAGLALVRAGWQFLSDDGPFLCRSGTGIQILGWHAPVNAAWTTALLFPELQPIFATHHGQAKCSFSIEKIYGLVSTERAFARLILLPSLTDGEHSALRRLSTAAILAELIAHSIDGWDRSIMAEHFTLLSSLTDMVPAYHLALGSDLDRLPALIADVLPAN